jgi:LIVCS family branched-chain amino acid:cation transporter
MAIAEKEKKTIKFPLNFLFFSGFQVFMGSVPKSIKILSIGFALFSMFFGAGNIVFPLLAGQLAGDKALWSLLGLTITAVGVPFLGLFAMILFDGDYRRFFARLGRIPALLIVIAIMGLIGPFGALPRCIALSYATMKMFSPGVGPWLFCFISCLVIFLFTVRKSRIPDVLGYFLTPFLLCALAVITIKGMLVHPPVPHVLDLSNCDIFSYGFLSGYHTMDLLGSFFFFGIVIESLKTISSRSKHSLYFNSLAVGFVGATLLAAVYVGLSLVASFHARTLAETPADLLLGTIAYTVLGSFGGIATCVAVILACLTTAIALAAIFAEFIHYDLFRDKLNYTWSLLVTLTVAFFVATLEFNGIESFLTPVIGVVYPSLIVLAIANIAHELWGFRYVKLPVGITFLISLIYSFM